MRRARFLFWLDVALLLLLAPLEEPVTTGLAGAEWGSMPLAVLVARPAESAAGVSAIAVLGWRASAFGSDSGGGPAPDFTVVVDTPAATTLGTQGLVHGHLP